MNLFDIRKHLVDTTTRFDLVVNRTTYEDKGANFAIHQGHRKIQRMLDIDPLSSVFMKDIVSGTFFVQLEDFRSINKDGVLLTKLDSRIVLEKRSIQEIRHDYGKPFNLMTPGDPTQYAIATSRLSPEFRALRLPGSSLLGPIVESNIQVGFGTSQWTVTGFTLSGDAIIGRGAGFQDIALLEADKLAPERTYEVRFTVTSYTVGTLRAYVGATQHGTTVTSSGAFTFNIKSTTGVGVLQGTGNPKTQFSSDGKDLRFEGDGFDGTITSVLVQELFTDYTLDFTHDFDSVFLGTNASTTIKYGNTGIIIMLPPDETYTLTVDGKFWLPRLDADTDTDWLTEQHEGLVELGARWWLEIDRRNQQGADQFLEQMIMYVRELNRDQIEHDIAEFEEFIDERAFPVRTIKT